MKAESFEFSARLLLPPLPLRLLPSAFFI